MSLGYGLPSLPVREALQDALNRGVVIVASSGNSGGTATAQGRGHAPYSFPADYPGVLGVAAVGENSEPASFSSDNISVQVAAPGVEVPAQGRDGQYWLVSGTSPACALTAGVAALIKSAYPALPPDLVREAITSTTSDRPRSGYDDEVGFGNVDAAAALKAAGRLSARGLAGPGSPRTGLRRTAILTPGVSADSHFGGGRGGDITAPGRATGRPATRAVLRSGRGLPGDDRHRHKPSGPDAAAGTYRRVPRRCPGRCRTGPARRRPAGRPVRGRQPHGAATAPMAGRTTRSPRGL